MGTLHRCRLRRDSVLHCSLREARRRLKCRSARPAEYAALSIAPSAARRVQCSGRSRSCVLSRKCGGRVPSFTSKITTSRLIVSRFGMSLDGFGAGPRQSLDNPLGVNGPSLMSWAFTTRTFQQMHGCGGGVAVNGTEYTHSVVVPWSGPVMGWVGGGIRSACGKALRQPGRAASLPLTPAAACPCRASGARVPSRPGRRRRRAPGPFPGR